MATRSNSSRERILETAESIILQKGFAATSIEDIVQKAAITKGGFFYHFSDRNELAKALATRYLEADDEIFSRLFDQADNLTEDPLHQLLIFLKLFADMMSELESTHPGCLVVSFTYESQQFDDEVRELIKEGVLRWRTVIGTRLDRVAEKYTPRIELDDNALADMFTSSIEGGIILCRIFEDNRYLVQQIMAYRDYLRLMFDISN